MSKKILCTVSLLDLQNIYGVYFLWIGVFKNLQLSLSEKMKLLWMKNTVEHTHFIWNGFIYRPVNLDVVNVEVEKEVEVVVR